MLTLAQWILAGVVLLVLSAAAGWLVTLLIAKEIPDVESTPLPPQGARRRQDAHAHRPGGDLSPLSAAEQRYAGQRDETIGVDQYTPERRRRVRDLQPLSLRQREALGLVKRGR